MGEKKILFFTLDHFDYLSDGFLISLKSLENCLVFEYGSNKYIYKESISRAGAHGNAFTLGACLNISEQLIHLDLNNIKGYNLYVISSIYYQSNILKVFSNIFNFSNTIILDGGDSPSLFPFYGNKLHDIINFNFPFLRFIYFKRELIKNKSFFTKFNKYIPDWIFEKIDFKNVHPVSFVIPDDKIIQTLPIKTKLFPKHIVDLDLIPYIEGSQDSYVFNTEDEYYNDLRSSKYGITTKRAGWDCMRHYEIAANGAVICFKNLHLKPNSCAPHDLIDGYNCLNYENYKSLMEKISNISDERYLEIQRNSISWVKSKSSTHLAKKIIKDICL